MTATIGYVFVEDSLFNYIPSFDNLGKRVSPKKKKLFALIISKGIWLNVSFDTLLSFLPDTIHKINIQDYEKYEAPEYNLTVNEINTLNALNSVENSSDRLNDNNPDKERRAIKKENKLFRSKYFKSYQKKLQQHSKMLMILFPILRYKNYFLLVIGHYPNHREPYLSVDIIK